MGQLVPQPSNPDWQRLIGEKPESSTLSALYIETIAVVQGLKPAGRFTLLESAANALVSKLSSLGLVASSYTPENWGYSSLSSEEQSVRSLKARVRVLYARDVGTLESLMEAHLNSDNQMIGQLLGYPGCCIAANELYSLSNFSDYVRVARGGNGFDWRLSIFLGELEACPHGSPYALISHFPCSLTCDASVNQSQERYELVRKLVPEFASRLASLLQMPILLHDDSSLDPLLKTGLAGAVLFGVNTQKSLVFNSWLPLRRRKDIPCGLDKADTVVQTRGGIELRSSRSKKWVRRLEKDQWMLLAPH